MGKLDYSKVLKRTQITKGGFEPAVEGGYVRDWQGKAIPVVEARRFAEAQKGAPEKVRHEKKKAANAEKVAAEHARIDAVFRWARTTNRLEAYDTIIESLFEKGDALNEGNATQSRACSGSCTGSFPHENHVTAITN